MSFSLNEIETMSKKAARGAGYAWGMAEEAAKATRWLCTQGLDGVSVLVQAMEPGAGGCPLAAGAALSDGAAALPNGSATLTDLRQPVMLLPFAALVARQLGVCVQVECAGVQAITDGQGLRIDGVFPAVAAELRITTGSPSKIPGGRITRATPDPANWDALCRLADRTYAPATDESRRLGAGAGLSDND